MLPLLSHQCTKTRKKKHNRLVHTHTRPMTIMTMSASYKMKDCFNATHLAELVVWATAVINPNYTVLQHT